MIGQVAKGAGSPTLGPWQGARRASLTFAPDAAGRSFLARQYVEYPFHITRALYLHEGWRELASVCLQSVSGGLFRLDRLELALALGQGAAAQVVSQSACKVHGMDGARADQSTTVELGPGAFLDLRLDPLILFPQADLHTATAVQLAPGARALISESHGWYRADGGVLPAFEAFEARVSVSRQGQPPAWRERLLARDPAGRAHLRETFLRFPWHGTTLALSDRPVDGLLETLRGMASTLAGCQVGVSRLPGDIGLVARYAAGDGATLRRCELALRAAAYPLLAGGRALRDAWAG